MRRLVRHFGLVIGLAGLVLVIRELFDGWDIVVAAARTSEPLLLLAALGLGGAGMVVLALAWRWSLALLGAPRPVTDALYRYFVGELGKYIPGGIWAVLGRGEMTRRAGIRASVSYGSTLLSLAAAYLAAMLTASLALAAGGAMGDEAGWLAVIALLPIGVLALHPRLLKVLLGVVGRLTGREVDFRVPRWTVSVRLVVCQVPAWLAIGGATWLIAYSLDESTPGLVNLVLATVVAWIAGFLAFPVPGGIGVREAVFLSLATTISSPAIAAAVAVTGRLTFVLVDLLGAGAFVALAQRRLSLDKL